MSLLRRIADFMGIPVNLLPDRPHMWSYLRIFLLALSVVWLFTCFIQVNANQVGVVVRFGKWVRNEPPGFHLKLPFPIEQVYYPVVTSINRISILSGTKREVLNMGQFSWQVENDLVVNNAGLMLTGDTNIVDIDFSVLWRIKDASSFLFRIDNPQEKLIALSESIVRDIVAQDTLENILTGGRQNIEMTAQRDIQSTLDNYGSGIEIVAVKLHRADPPQAVISDFRDVQAAAADRERMINEAEGYANDILPRNRGEANVIINQAKAYKESRVNEAQGIFEAWSLLAEQYNIDPELTKKKLYIEILTKVLSKLQKVIITNPNLKSYIVLPELDRLRRLNK